MSPQDRLAAYLGESRNIFLLLIHSSRTGGLLHYKALTGACDGSVEDITGLVAAATSVPLDEQRFTLKRSREYNLRFEIESKLHRHLQMKDVAIRLM